MQHPWIEINSVKTEEVNYSFILPQPRYRDDFPFNINNNVKTHFYRFVSPGT